MNRIGEWLNFLLPREMQFNHEVHLLGSGEKRVECLPENGHLLKSGWFLTYSDTEAGEWNMARAFGDPRQFTPLLQEFPHGMEFHLLLPAEAEDYFRGETGLTAQDRLTWFKDPFVQGSNHTEPDSFQKAISRGYELRFFEKNPGNDYSFNLQGVLLEEGFIVSTVKTTHTTPASLEVYIETIPHLRDKGLGTYLLARFIERCRADRKTLIYVISADNAPSLKVAAKLGLVPYQELQCLLFKNTSPR